MSAKKPVTTRIAFECNDSGARINFGHWFCKTPSIVVNYLYKKEEIQMSRKYSDEFKRNALEYIKDHPDVDMRVCAEYLGLPYDTLYGWYKKDQREKRNESVSIRDAGMSDEEKEIMRLKRELRDTQDALEVLKKAISILGD